MRPNAGFYNLFMKGGWTDGSKEGIQNNPFLFPFSFSWGSLVIRGMRGF